MKELAGSLIDSASIMERRWLPRDPSIDLAVTDYYLVVVMDLC